MSSRQIGEKILERLVKRGEDMAGVFALPVSPGVKDRFKESAIKLGVPYVEARNMSSQELNILAQLRTILPESVLNYPMYGTIGWHPSPLPKYAGTNSVIWPIIFGETKTANTIFWTDRRIDAGPILLQKEVHISPDDTSGSLYYDKIIPSAVEAIDEAIDLIKKGIAPRVPQNLSQYSYYSFVTEKDTIINWVQPATRIYDLIRGTNPTPGATTNIGNRVFKVLDSELRLGFEENIVDPITTAAIKAGGVVDITSQWIKVIAPDGVILIKAVRFNGFRMSATDFAQEVGLRIGDRFGS
jgi:methionyl-tRNA formyltransferase